jgi:hypothetical protein
LSVGGGGKLELFLILVPVPTAGALAILGAPLVAVLAPIALMLFVIYSLG